LATMKKGALVLNVARGGVLDEAALVEALQHGRIAGAALDVFEKEPLPADHPLRTMPNVLLTPHLGASTTAAQETVAVEIADAVRRMLLQGDFSAAVNASEIAARRAREPVANGD